MVLQPEDVPAELTLLEEDGETHGLVEPLYDPRASAMFVRGFELTDDQAESGDVVCIASSVLLYDTSADARGTFREVSEVSKLFLQQLNESNDGDSYTEIDSPDLATLGDRRQGIHFAGTHSGHCPLFEDQPVEGNILVFVYRNVSAGVFVDSYEAGASFDEALQLAERQLERIAVVLEDRSHD